VTDQRIAHRPLGALEVLVGTSAIAGGVALVANGMGMSTADLARGPFDSYTVPGLALTALVGVPLVVAGAAAWRGDPWWPPASAAAGAALFVFELVEAYALGGVRHPLQLVYAALALPPLTAGLRGLRRLGATEEEARASYPGDDLVPGGRRHSVMAATIPAPPEDVWPWLVQMGADRAGFYSFDRLDNGGRPSADRIHAEWQREPRVGDRMASVPDGSRWFDVALVEPGRALVLRASLALPAGRCFDPEAELPRAFTDGTWGFHLTPTQDGGTRLVVTGTSRARPRRLVELGNRLFWDPAHWVMQARQFAGLRRRATPRRPVIV
jgi:proline iminopeptidase